MTKASKRSRRGHAPKRPSRYDPAGYIDAKGAADGSPVEALAIDKRSRVRSYVDCAPQRAAASGSAPTDLKEVAVQEGGAGQPVVQDGLPAATDLAKAIVDSAKKNCRPAGAAPDSGISVSVSRAESLDPSGKEETGLRAMRPTVGFSKSF